MTLHQVNADGAGPMACSVDATGNGIDFQTMTITTNVPGNNGVFNVNNKDFPLVATMPSAVTCSGSVAGQNNLCFVKCQNPQGPFGGVVAVQSGVANTTVSTNSQGGNKGQGKKGSSAKADRAVGVRAMLLDV